MKLSKVRIQNAKPIVDKIRNLHQINRTDVLQECGLPAHLAGPAFYDAIHLLCSEGIMFKTTGEGGIYHRQTGDAAAITCLKQGQSRVRAAVRKVERTQAQALTVPIMTPNKLIRAAAERAVDRVEHMQLQMRYAQRARTFTSPSDTD